MPFVSTALSELIGLIAGIVAAIAFLPYVLAILRGETVPNRVTWFVLSINGWLALASYKEVGADATIWLAWSHALLPALICVLSFKYGEGGVSRFDIYCLITAILGILLWKLTKLPLLGLVFFLTADLAALMPTIYKSWYRPDTEDRFAWTITTLSAAINIFAIDSLEIGVVVHPVYMLLIDGIITYFLWRPKLRK